MKRKSFILGIIICILLTTILSGCGYNTPKSLSGKYIGQEHCYFDYIEFFSDGKYTSSNSNYQGNYSIDGNRLHLNGLFVESKIFYFRTSGNTLELSFSEDFENAYIYKK